MNAVQLLTSIQREGVELILVGDDNIKAHPRSALSDGLRILIRMNKPQLIAALKVEHRNKRKIVGHRVEVLKIILSRLINNDVHPTAQREQALEKFIDTALINFKYDLEKAIDYYRSIAPKPIIVLAHCVTCGYRPLFCSCEI